MAKIYAKASDQTLILAPREFMLRQFDLGLWTEIRLGMFLNVIDQTNDNASPPTETVTLNTAVDRFCFGIKNTDTTSIPGQTGSNFIGITNDANCQVTTNPPFDNRLQQTSSTFKYSTMKDTTIAINANAAQSLPTLPNGASGTSNYAGFYGLKITIANRGTSTQAVTLQTCFSGVVSSSTYNLTELRSAVTTFASAATASTSMAWNDGTSAYPVPDCFFIRMPAVTSRIRLSAIDVVRIS